MNLNKFSQSLKFFRFLLPLILIFSAITSSIQPPIIILVSATDPSTITINRPVTGGKIFGLANHTFTYTPDVIWSSIENASFHIGGGILTFATDHWNTTAIENKTINSFNYSFTDYGTHIWNVELFNATHSISAESNFTVTVETLDYNWLIGWDYRKWHQILQQDGAGENYQVQIRTLRYAGSDTGMKTYLDDKCQDDYDDIRFTDADGVTEIDYWFEYASATSAYWWVEVPGNLSLCDQYIYVYYGNSTVETTSNMTETFPFADPFLTAERDPVTLIRNDLWDRIGATNNPYVASGGYANLLHVGDDEGDEIEAKSSFSFTAGHAWGSDGRRQWSDPVNSPASWGARQTGDMDNAIYLLCREQGESQYLDFWTYSGSVGHRTTSSDWGPSSSWPLTFSFYETRWNGTHAEFATAGTPVRGSADASHDTDIPGGSLELYFTEGSDPIDDLWFSYVYLRKYVYPEPVHGDWGSEGDEAPVELFNVDVTILNMEGCGNWIFSQERNYIFNATYRHTGSTSYFDQVGIRFLDGVNNMTFYYNHSLSTETDLSQWSMVVDPVFDVDRLPIDLKETLSSVSTSGDYLYVNFSIWLTGYVFDALDVDIWMYASDTLEHDTGWEKIAVEYVNIYNLGGQANMTSVGSAGRTTGGDVFELYAGTEYSPADILDETFESVAGSYPSGWVNYQPNNTDLDLTQDGARDPTGGNLWNYRLTDASPTGYVMTFRRNIALDGNFTWQTYIRLSQTDAYFDIEGSALPYRPILIQFNTTGFINYFASGGVKTLIGAYSADVWYNITLVVNVDTDTYDIYVNDSLEVDDATFWDPVTSIVNIEYVSGSEHPSSQGVTQIDDIKIYKDWAGGTTGWISSNVTYRKLQHFRMLVHVNNIFEYKPEGWSFLGNIYSWYPDVGSWYVGMDYCEPNDDWMHGWYAKITPIVVECDIDNKWMKYSVEWYYKDVLIKNETQTTLIDMDATQPLGSRTFSYTVWIDFWFNKINASSTVGGRINSEYWGMSQQAPWWSAWWKGDWKVQMSALSESMLFVDLEDQAGNIISSPQIKLMRPWMKVDNTEASNPGPITLVNFDSFVWTFARDGMVGVNTPEPIKTKAPDMPDTGFVAGLVASIKNALSFSAYAILSFWGTFVGFLDTVFTFVGFTNGFSVIIGWIRSFTSWVVTAGTYLVSILSSLFSLMAVWLVLGIERFIALGSGLVVIYNNLVWIYAEANAGWVDASEIINPLLPILPLAFFIWILNSKDVYEMFGKISLCWNFVRSIAGFFIQIGQYVLQLITGLIESIPVVE